MVVMKKCHTGIGTLMYLTAIEVMTNNIVVMKQVHGLSFARYQRSLLH